MPELLWDVRFGLRLLARSPAFALTASLLLAIGISANTLIFSVTDALLLRPLPVKDAERLVRLVEVHPTGFVTWDLPYDLYDVLSKKSSSVTDVVCQVDLDVALRDASGTERIRINAVSPNFFTALGVNAQVGRVLTPHDEQAESTPAVLSYNFARRRFGGASSSVGQSVVLNGSSFTIVGVLPEGMNGLTVDTAPDVRVPLSAGPRLTGKRLDSPGTNFSVGFQIFGRLRPGVLRESAEAEIHPLLRPVYEQVLGTAMSEPGKPAQKYVIDSRLRLEPAGKGVSALRAQFSQGLLVLMSFVALLLLMACANVAALLLARSAGRSQEITIRLALGASAWRIARQLLTESLLLGGFGGFLGIGLTYAALPVLLRALPPVRDRAAVVQPLAVHIEVNLRVLGFALLVTLCTAVLFGLSPALRGAQAELSGALRGGRGATRRLALQQWIVVAQVAICTLLLAGAGVLVETLNRMRSMDAGFDRDHVITFTVDPQLGQYREEQVRDLSRKLLDKTVSLPSVAAASIAGRGLMRGTGVKATFGVSGTPIRSRDFLNASLNWVTPGYFETMRMRIVAGRDFSWFDDDQSKPLKVVVNQAFVRRFFPHENPIGRTFGGKGPNGLAAAANQIIGVVTDAKYRSLREEIPPTVYTPVVNGFRSGFILHLRTGQRPETIIKPVQAALRSLDPELPFVEVKTLREEVDTSLWQEKLLARLSMIFAILAGFLASIGLYGALDYSVKTRSREIGVRVALGAAPARIVRLLSREMLLPLVGGAVIGILLYGASSTWIRQVLYGVPPSDPVAIGAALLTIGVIAVTAAAGPIVRAVRTDPAQALRQE